MSIVVFGIASDASVEQYDAHRPPRGIMLRWFLPDLDLPPLGFDIYRAIISDIAPLPFDDASAAAATDHTRWTFAGSVTLSCAQGLRFEPSSRPGWRRLVIRPNAPVRVTFSSPAWRIRVRAETVGAGVEVSAVVSGAETVTESLLQPGAQLLWRARDVDEIVLRGEGTVSFIGCHLQDDARFWTHVVHRCLPVHDPAYPCGPRGAATEDDEASMRLPTSVAADWPTRFADPFHAMLPALHRLARGDPPAPIPPDSLDPLHPRLNVGDSGQERSLIRLASIDPHVARILGLAYDDGVALTGQEYAYKITGTWRRTRHAIDGRRLAIATVMRRFVDAGARVNIPPGGTTAEIDFPGIVLDFSLASDGSVPVKWTADDGKGQHPHGVLDRTTPALSLPQLSTLQLEWAAGRPPSILQASWYDGEVRTGILPSVFARDPGPPKGPPSIVATVQLAGSPSAIASAALDWPVPVAPDGTVAEGDPVAYQIGRRLLAAAKAAAAPATGPASSKDVVRPRAPIYLSPQAVAETAPRTLHTDNNDGSGLDPGWWGWWVRGVDLFGRVSEASSWAVAKVDDVAPPPAPVLVQAEWVQRSLPDMTLAVVGRSVEARRWLAATAADDPVPEAGLVAAWALPPEQAALRDDIDGFRLSLRRTATRQGAPAGAALIYPDWPAAIMDFGPLQITARGAIVAVTPDPAITVQLAAADRLPDSPHTRPDATTARTALRTDLELDGASGVFVGGSLVIGPRSLTVVANGDGPDLVVVVEHDRNDPPPAAGQAVLSAPAKGLLTIETDVPDITGSPHLVARSGMLLDAAATPSRYPVLRKSGGAFLCINVPPASGETAVAPAAGNEVTWYPVWCASLSDSGFGPLADAATPVANAQVAVQALRLIQTRALASVRSAPLTVTAVDVAPPPVPTIASIGFDPAASCAQLATRADWYGNSRFTLSWSPQADSSFTVYRALADEVFRLDREYMSAPDAQRDVSAPMWPDGAWTDAARKARVEQELATLDEALGDPDTAAQAYDGLCIDTQMLIARQPQAWPAFMPLFGRPIAETTYTDTLNGRTRAHWIYAVTARSPAGVESAPSAISPPICCPDVVAPAPPLAHSALAGDGAVKLKWLASPDADTHHYEIYAARDPAARLDALTPVPSYDIFDGTPTPPTPTYVPTPHVSGKTIERLVPRARNQMGDWCFWIVAVDTSDNRSKPSTMLRGKALVPPPLPPVWVSAERNAGKVDLTWTYPTGDGGYSDDPRWACLIERYSESSECWSAVSKWLPRGIYALSDQPPDLNAAWSYRVRVRDYEMRAAPSIPEIVLDEEP